MERKILKVLSVAILLAITGCSTAPGGNKVDYAASVYDKRGMEISKVVSEMSDIIFETMRKDLKDSSSKSVNRSSSHPGLQVFSDPTFPKVAVTSFVDTDTYENAGYLGRSMAEMFVHELDRRGIAVFEYKLTGSISITKDGEFVFSRNWKKVARQAMVKHILAGTITRNQKGIVVVARVINMSNSTVVGSATGFIPYENLPYCYRTGEKNCSINGVSSYFQYSPDGKGSGAGVYSGVNYRSSLTPAQQKIVDERKEKEFVQNYYQTDRKEFNDKYYVKGVKVPGTSTGNYERYLYEKRKGYSSGNSSVIYPANTYIYNDRLVRDVHDESHYSRVSE